MISIKYKLYGDKKYRKMKMPIFDELTTGQYLRFKEFEKQDFISYLAMIFETDRVKASMLSLRMPENIEKLVGVEKDWEIYKPKRKYYLGYELKEIETIGQRYCYTRNQNGYSGFKTYPFILAISLAGNDDVKKITNIYSKLMEENYYEVMGLGFFLLKNLEIGIIRDMPILKRFPYLIKMMALRTKLGLKRWINGLYTMRYKHFVNYSI